MKEIRITFRSEDFAAVSQSMLKLGVTFQVEPIEDEEEQPVRATPAAPPKRRQAKRKSGRAARVAAASADTTRDGSGAARLRAIVERNRSTGERPSVDTIEPGQPADAGGMPPVDQT